MLDEPKIQILKRAIKFKYDEHISSIIRVPQNHLEIKDPNRWWPVVKMLKGVNSETSHLVQQYGENLKNEIVRVIESFNLTNFTEEDKKKVFNILNQYVDPELYKKRFSIMLSIIEREHQKYGLVFEKEKYRIDIPKSICEVDSYNHTRRILAKIDMELDCVIQKYNKLHIVTTEKNSVSNAEEFLELKPNFMGIGININAIIKKISRKNSNK